MEGFSSSIIQGDLKKIIYYLTSGQNLTNEELETYSKLARDRGIAIIEALILLHYPNAIDSYTSLQKEQLIIALLSQFSQDVYASNWQDNIEYDVWNWASNLSKPPDYFTKKRVISDSKIILETGNLIQLWATWDTTNEKPIPIPLNQWIKKTGL
ncbi:hypothetical protein [uncultured Dokdonia sp.]|uniref:hypothetical protein n=1 Tax=uncultured Dokdonia sp. TaxID=575653 RepID=UPI0026181CC1|nr:hypothetical protein [uncultured Dokdonia sp.]